MEPQELVNQIEGLMREQQASYQTSKAELQAGLKELTEVKAQLRVYEERTGRPAGLARTSAGRAPGAAFVASEQFTAWKSLPNRRGRVTVDIPNPLFESKAVTPMLTSGNTPPVTRIPGIPNTWPLNGALQLITATGTNAGSIDYLRSNIAGTEHAAAQVEGSVKQSANLDTTLVSDKAATVAVYTKASTQVLSDITGLQAFISGSLLNMLAQELDREVLLGAGSGSSEVTGLIAQVPSYSTAADVTGDTPLDTLSHAVAQLNLLGVMPNAVLVNGASAEKIRLVKDGNDSYLAGYPSTAGTPSVWSLSVVIDKNVAADQFIIGDFSAANLELLMRQDATVDIALENEDDFIRNLMTVRAELRAILALYLPAAFLKGSFPAASFATAGNSTSTHTASHRANPK